MTSATVECTVLGAAVVPTRKFSVPLPESFDELAKSVFEITTIPVERLQLICAGKRLKAGALASQGCKAGSKLMVKFSEAAEAAPAAPAGAASAAAKPAEVKQQPPVAAPKKPAEVAPAAAAKQPAPKAADPAPAKSVAAAAAAPAKTAPAASPAPKEAKEPELFLSGALLNEQHRCGLFAFGNGGSGRLGLKSQQHSLFPQRVTAFVGKPVRLVAAGGSHSLAVTEDGGLYTWGQYAVDTRIEDTYEGKRAAMAAAAAAMGYNPDGPDDDDDGGDGDGDGGDMGAAPPPIVPFGGGAGAGGAGVPLGGGGAAPAAAGGGGGSGGDNGEIFDVDDPIAVPADGEAGAAAGDGGDEPAVVDDLAPAAAPPAMGRGGAGIPLGGGGGRGVALGGGAAAGGRGMPLGGGGGRGRGLGAGPAAGGRGVAGGALLGAGGRGLVPPGFPGGGAVPIGPGMMIGGGGGRGGGFGGRGRGFAGGMPGMGGLGAAALRGERGERAPKLGTALSPVLLEQFTAQRHNVVQIAAGSSHSLIVTDLCAVFAFGVGDAGQLGLGSFRSVRYPTRIEKLRHMLIKSVAAGSFHSLALDATGKVFSFGQGRSGQLGKGKPGSTEGVHTPQLVSMPGEARIRAVAAGGHHSIAVADSEDVNAFVFGAARWWKPTAVRVAWGLEAAPVETKEGEATTAGSEAKDGDASSAAAGAATTGVESKGPSEAKSAAAAAAAARAAAASGSGSGSGSASSSAAASDSKGKDGGKDGKESALSALLTSQWRTVRASGDSTFVLTAAGHVFEWASASNPGDLPIRVTDLDGHHVVDVDCGLGFAAALLANGSLLVRGKNEAGQCATGFGGDACEPVRSFQPVQGLSTHRVTAVSCGYSHVLATTALSSVGGDLTKLIGQETPYSDIRLAGDDGTSVPCSRLLLSALPAALQQYLQEQAKEAAPAADTKSSGDALSLEADEPDSKSGGSGTVLKCPGLDGHALQTLLRVRLGGSAGSGGGPLRHKLTAEQAQALLTLCDKFPMADVQAAAEAALHAQKQQLARIQEVADQKSQALLKQSLFAVKNEGKGAAAAPAGNLLGGGPGIELKRASSQELLFRFQSERNKELDEEKRKAAIAALEEKLFHVRQRQAAAARESKAVGSSGGGSAGASQPFSLGGGDGSDQLSLTPDVQIECSGERFAAHRALLACRAPYFASLFSQRFSGSGERTVKLPIPAEAFRCALSFASRGQCFVEGYLVPAVIAACQELQLEGLLDLVEQHLATQITAANAAILLQLADFHALPLLREYCRLFCVVNIGAVTATSDFQAIPGAEALAEELKQARRKLKKVGVALAMP